MKRPNGFTLIELLTVIAILLLLAAILFPVFRSVRDRANQSKCTSPLRSIGYALQMYCDDNDEGLPIGAYSTVSGAGGWNFSWHDALSWNVRDWGPFFCPAAPSDSHYRTSFGVNHFICGYGWAKRMTDITYPSFTVFATEKQNHDWAFYTWGEWGATEYWRPLMPRHNGKVLVLHIDGHVEALHPSKLVVATVQVQ
jgi:prepilin-type N-terminal cleavage/methylation domain-containing protein/prepilin-type processing-associated H-X9-DG protein